MDIQDFQNTIWQYFRENERVFPWRQTRDPYHVLVSEIMLQQTQADRVVPKYLAFLQAFPTLQLLAEASLPEVLRLWQGLGYNRRARFLQQSAQIICTQYKGVVPQDPEILDALPGIGSYTARAITTFANNQTEVFIETNIRRVFLHFFFKDQQQVEDKTLLPLIEESLDKTNPREWYYALMDYGAYLGKSGQNANIASKTYTKQSKFVGSLRQLRGEILRQLLVKKTIEFGQLISLTDTLPEKLTKALHGLTKDGLITQEEEIISLNER